MFAVKLRAILPAVMLVLMLGGCATASMNLSQEELQSIRIERVDIAYAPESFISWEKVEAPYVERVRQEKTSSGKPKPWKQVMQGDEDATKYEYQEIINSPEGKKYVQYMLSAELKRRVSERIVPQFQGARPVVMEITVHSLSIPGPVQRVVLGGAPMLGAVTVLKDAATGKELAKLDRMAAGHAGNGLLGVLVDQAFSDLEDRVFDAYINNLRDWLQMKRGG